MRLRLISHPPAPMMLFNIAFVPTDLHPLPHNWDSQLAILNATDLELPRSIYALDLSTWLTEILEEVTFDVVSLTVSAVFTDGHTEDWPLVDRACINLLQGVLDDLRQSVQRPASSHPPAPAPAPAPAPPSSPVSPVSPVCRKSAKHKKQRSLLMQLVQSLIPNNTPPNHLPVVAPPPPPPPTPPYQQSAEDVMYRYLTVSKELRQRARSGLLDAYRRFVAREMKSRLPAGGYTIWIAQSTLRRTEEHMARLMESSTSISTSLPDFSFDCQTATVPDDLFAYDDDADATSETASLSRTVGTESDGSSVHTPDSTCAFRRGTPAALALTDPDAEAFAALSRRALRLREHLIHSEAAQRCAAADEVALLAIAEVRGRRRAWLNRQLRGGAPLSDIGFAMPVQSSQLVRHAPVTAASIASSLHLQGVSPRLFPVAEENEEAADTSMDKVALPVRTRRHTQIRIRTKSVRYSRVPPGLDAEVAMEFGPPVLMVPSPAVKSLPYSVTTGSGSLPKNEFGPELGANGVIIADGKGDEYECGEWLPGIQLGSSQ